MRVKKEGALWPWVVAGVVLAAALAAGGYVLFRESREARVAPAEVFQPVTSYAGPRVSMRLYFPTKDGLRLAPEARDVKEKADKTGQARELVVELIRGPLTGLSPSFPAGTRVKGVLIDPKGTAYINLSRELQTDYSGGAWTETLTIYSLTNTLTGNIPEIKQVQILVEGNPVETLAGHIDASRPFSPRASMNKE